MKNREAFKCDECSQGCDLLRWSTMGRVAKSVGEVRRELLESTGLEDGSPRTELMFELVDRVVHEAEHLTGVIDRAVRPQAKLKEAESQKWLLDILAVSGVRLSLGGVEEVEELRAGLRSRIAELRAICAAKPAPKVGTVGRDHALWDAALVFDAVHVVDVDDGRAAKADFVVAVSHLTGRPLGVGRVKKLLSGPGPERREVPRVESVWEPKSPREYDAGEVLRALHRSDMAALLALDIGGLLGEAVALASSTACIEAARRRATGTTVWTNGGGPAGD